MKIAVLIIRILLGLMLLVFGLNWFFHFLPMPAPSGPSGAFMTALVDTGYMMNMVKGLEVLLGLMLLANVFVPLALIILAPIAVNMFAFHLFLDPAGIGGAAAVTLFNIILLYANLDSYKALLQLRPSPRK